MPTVPHTIDKISAAESDYLFVQTSQIPNAGKGLFTAIDIHKHEIVSEFIGEILTQQQADQRASMQQGAYFICMLNGKILDCMHFESFAKYANDAVGLRSGKCNNDQVLKNNCIIMMIGKNKVGIIATRKIKAGQEVLCSYGKEYWASFDV
jgi:uncharacterized protein